MSVQRALQFIRFCRQGNLPFVADDEDSLEVEFGQLLARAHEEGFEISEEELIRAHAIDWAMRARYLNYQRNEGEDD